MDYPAMEPPFPVKPFSEMNNKEAKANFDWYLSEIPNRMELLRTAFAQFGGGGREVLDFSPESLKPLGSWYKPYIKRVPKTQEELEAELAGQPEWMKPHIPTVKYAISTMILCNDISMYFAEVFLKHFEKIHWVIQKGKSYPDVNQPILKGFGKNGKSSMHPFTIVLNTTNAMADEREGADALYNIYKKWEVIALMNKD